MFFLFANQSKIRVSFVLLRICFLMGEFQSAFVRVDVPETPQASSPARKLNAVSPFPSGWSSESMGSSNNGIPLLLDANRHCLLVARLKRVCCGCSLSSQMNSGVVMHSARAAVRGVTLLYRNKWNTCTVGSYQWKIELKSIQSITEITLQYICWIGIQSRYWPYEVYEVSGIHDPL